MNPHYPTTRNMNLTLGYYVNYLGRNAANLKMNEGKHFEVDKQAYHEELIRLINYPDFMLYEHFNTTFWNRVNEMGRSVTSGHE